jgi:hypothetical protein
LLPQGFQSEEANMRTSSYVALFASLILVLGCAPATFLFAQGTVEGSFQRTLSVSGPQEVDISTGSGRIEVRSGATDRIEVRATIRVSERRRGRQRAEELVTQLESDPPIDQTGNMIRIGYLDDPEYRQNVSISYNVIVPTDTRLRSRTGSGSQSVDGVSGALDATAGSGSIAISNVQGEIRAQTGSGFIRIDQAGSDVSVSTGSGGITAERVAGAFRGNTGSGSVRFTQTGSGNVEVSTGSGSVELAGVRGALRARTGSGRITAGGDLLGDWDLQSGSGSITVRLPQQAAFDLNAHTSSGGITVDHPVTIQGTIRRNELFGQVRGGGFALNVRAASGSIRIE